MNLPNKLTIFRIILVPIMVIISYIQFNQFIFGIPLQSFILALIFIIASYTDHLDGKLARKNNQITIFGKFADPLADKILVLAAMIILVEKLKIPGWIPIVIIIREFAVSGYRLIKVQSKGDVIAANIWGKIKTVTQMIGIIAMFLCNYSYFQFINNSLVHVSLIQYVINIIASLMITISVIATVFSGYTYLKDAKELFKDS